MRPLMDTVYVPNRPPLRVDVLKDQDGICALTKPYGIHSFNTWFHRTGYPCLMSLGKLFWPKGNTPHRIDMTTSGVHMFGQHTAALSHAAKSWKTIVRKEYLAVIDGKPKFTDVEVGMMLKGANTDKKYCKTLLTPVGENLILAELTLHGRTHQIRHCLRSVGFPIRGDVLYGGTESHRIHLHAYRLHLEGWGTAVAAPPPEMGVDYPGDAPLWSMIVNPLTFEEWTAWDELRKETPCGRVEGWRPQIPKLVAGTQKPPKPAKL